MDASYSSSRVRPVLQALYRQVSRREDVQVVTLNVDQDQELVEAFLKGNKYTFPVLFARSFVESFAGPIGIPTTWIADRAGTIRLEMLGFGGDAAQWVERTIRQLEEVRDGKVALRALNSSLERLG